VASWLAAPGLVDAEEPAVVAPLAGMDLTLDTDEFRSARLRAGAYHSYDNPWSFAGVAVDATRYSQGDYRRDAAAVIALYRDQRRDTLAGIDIAAGVARVAGHLRPIGEAGWRVIPGPATAIDLILSADLVETRPALERGIGTVFVAASAEQQLGPRLTVTGLAGWQSFSDGNDRVHARARLIWLAVPEHGVTLQARYRHYASHTADVGGAYFNPARHQQLLGVVAVRKRHAGWVFSAALGAGGERSAGSGSEPSYVAEARAEGPIGAHARLVLRAGYERAQGYAASSDYGHGSLGVAVVVPLP
jgi:hypothetical protein